MGFRTNLLKFDKNNCPENFTFILANKSLTHLGQLNNVETSSVHYVGNLNGADELSLKVYKSINGEVEPLWDDIVDFKTLYVAEVGEYFEITVSLDDEKNGYKTLTCTSLCEAELSNLNLYDMEINTENEADVINTDISVEEYKVTVFYNEENPDKSLLHRVLKDKAPHYTIKYVDDSLKNEIRSFSINGTSIYSFLTCECAEQFNCIFVFNSPDRSISVYDLYTVCNNCGYRGAYNDVCPECGSDFLNYFGNDTTIYIDKENFAENIKFEVDTNSVKNCFRLVAGDDIMTATVRSLNQNGSNYLYYITDDDKKDMSSELVEKLDSYDELYGSYKEEYQQLLEDYYKAVDDELFYTSSMMPEKPSDDEDDDNDISIANKEIVKLTSKKMSPVGVVNITTSTSISTINNAVENYAKVFVNTSLVKVKVVNSTFNYKGKESNTDFDYGEWTGTIQLTSYSDEEDIATTTLNLTAHDNYADFAQQKVMKEIARDDSDHSIYDVIGIEDLDEFKEALTYYSLSRLKSFETAIETALDTLIGINQGSKDAETYDVFYSPYCDKRDACITEREKRELTIAEIRDQINDITKRMSEIQEVLNFENYLGTNLYKEFSSYRREQEYNNSNYISDGLDNAKIIERAKEFIESAKKELYKSATKQGHITADLNNLLAMKEFKPLVENFALGNFIRVNVDGVIHRLRLIKFEIDFSNLTKIPVEFSDMTITSNGLNDVKSILDAAQSMNRSYSYTAKQAEKGENANLTFEKMYQDGLNSALYRIKNNDNEEVIIDKGGILGRSFDDIENDYSQEQVRITHNLICFTDDNWRSVEQAIGKHNYWKFDSDGIKRQYTGFGVSAKFLTAPFINNGQFIGGEIYSTNYSSTTGTYMNLLDGSCNLGHKIIYDAPSDKITMRGVTIEWDSSNAPEISNIKGLSDRLSTMNTDITKAQTTANSAKSVADNAKTIGDNLVNVLGYDGTKITGTYIYSPVISGGSILVGNKNGTYAEITPEGVLNCNGANVTGVIKATSGSIDSISATNLTITSGKITLGNTMLSSTGTSTIGGWIIGSKAIYNGTNSLTSTTSGTYLGTDGIRQYASSSAYIHMQNGVLTANGANVSGKLTAGSGSVLGADSYIGSSGSGWKITNNQIHTVKTTTVNVNGTNVTQPLLTLSAGSDASGTYLYAPNYFQIGGALDGVGNIGANFVGKVFIGGDCSITGNCNITGDCNITGAAIATNLTITGDSTIGDWTIDTENKGLKYESGSEDTILKTIIITPNGIRQKISSTDSELFYIVIKTVSKVPGQLSGGIGINENGVIPLWL